MSEGEELMSMCDSIGWGIAKRKLMERISDLSDILAYDEKDPEKLMLEIAANQQAVKILIEWMNDIEGEVARVQDYRTHSKKIQEQRYIKILE